MSKWRFVFGCVNQFVREMVPHKRKCPLAVVRESANNHLHTARAKTFVNHLLELILGSSACGFAYPVFNIVLWYIISLHGNNQP